MANGKWQMANQPEVFTFAIFHLPFDLLMAAHPPIRPMPPGPPDMSVGFAGLTFKNPVIAASGTFGYGVEFEDVVALDKLGGFVVKGL
jgi:hypothetical protein